MVIYKANSMWGQERDVKRESINGNGFNENFTKVIETSSHRELMRKRKMNRTVRGGCRDD